MNTQAKPEAKPETKPAPMYVLDTTCRPGPTGSRTHDMVVGGLLKPFTFEYGKPLGMPREVALKFLKHEPFKHTNADGDVIPYQRAPKQPEDLGAGEALTVNADETVARFDELSTIALQNRSIATFGGEKYATSADRDAMVAFLVAAKPKLPDIVQRKTVDREDDLLDDDGDEDMPVTRSRRAA